jgi:hypothetical protein
MKVRLLLGNAEIAEVRTSPNLSGFPTYREVRQCKPGRNAIGLQLQVQFRKRPQALNNLYKLRTGAYGENR